MKIKLLVISILILLVTGCGSKKKIVYQVPVKWTKLMIISLDKDDKNEEYRAGTFSYDSFLHLEYATKKFSEILSVLEYSLKNSKDIELVLEDSVYGFLITDARKLEDDN